MKKHWFWGLGGLWLGFWLGWLVLFSPAPAQRADNIPASPAKTDTDLIVDYLNGLRARGIYRVP